jgi:hypothetical protein
MKEQTDDFPAELDTNNELGSNPRIEETGKSRLPAVLKSYKSEITAPTTGRILTSYDMDTREGKMSVYRAKQKADLNAQQAMVEPFAAVHVVLHPVMITSRDDGELFDAVRTVLIDPDGRRLSFVSDGACRAIMDLAEAIGPAPWNPPVLIRVRQVPTKRGHTYELDVVPPK